MKKPELLAPAGNIESLKAAIMAGCDAVYLGGYMFGARSYAGNFSNEELESAIRYAHLYNVKVYVTTNTIIYEDEVETFMNYIDYLYNINVDAIIIQDLGMMDLVRQTYPDLEVHASTQMHIHNLEGVKFAKEMGLTRAVIARETPIEVIRDIKDNVDIELEVFVHGALCVSYSGQCFMSTLIGNRSGNRGTCAQCCRQKYSLKQNNKLVDEGYLLSTKDLNTLMQIDDLIEAGVDSFKIEGRMKRPEYVYLVVSMYRKAIDSYFETGKVKITDKDIYELKKIFNREFTRGFLFHEDNNKFTNSFRPNHMGVEIGKVISQDGKYIKIKLTKDISIFDGIRIVGDEDYGLTLNVFKKNKEIVKEAFKDDIIELEVKSNINVGSIVLKTTDYKQLNEISSLIKENNRKVNVDAYLYINKNKKIEMTVICDNITEKVVLDFIPEVALKQETTKEQITKQLEKLGDTVYTYNHLVIDLDSNLFVPVQKINELRRTIFNSLDKKRLERKRLGKSKYNREVPNFNKEEKVSILVKNIDTFKEFNKHYDTLYVENDLYNKIDNKDKILKLPRVLLEHNNYTNKLLVGEIGSVYKYKNIDTDFSLNVVNSYTVALLHSLGVNKITLSYEINKEQIKSLIDNYHKRYNKHPNLEVIVDTYPEAMITKYNLFNKYDLKDLVLVDRLNNHYKLKKNEDTMTIYNYEKLVIKDNLYELGINSIRYELF